MGSGPGAPGEVRGRSSPGAGRVRPREGAPRGDGRDRCPPAGGGGGDRGHRGDDVEEYSDSWEGSTKCVEYHKVLSAAKKKSALLCSGRVAFERRAIANLNFKIFWGLRAVRFSGTTPMGKFSNFPVGRVVQKQSVAGNRQLSV